MTVRKLILKVIREVEVVVVRCIGNEVLTSMCIAVTTGTKCPIGVLKGTDVSRTAEKDRPEKHTERLGTADFSGTTSEESSGSKCQQWLKLDDEKDDQRTYFSWSRLGSLEEVDE